MAFPGQRLGPVFASIGRWIERSSYLKKWILLGALIGVTAGIGAVIFYSALSFASHVFLGILAGYHVPTPYGEGDRAGSAGYARPWVIPLVVALGGLLSGILVFSFAPEAEGHGTDAAIDAVHKNPRAIRVRAVLVKIVASAITIGSGGSGGREGPTAQISAGAGSFLARLFNLSPEDGRIAVSIGIGSGIGAIFGAPLGGAVLSADIVYRDDFEIEALIPGLIASIIGYTVFGFIENFSPLFGYSAAHYEFNQPIQLVWFALIGLAGGLIGLAYAKGFYGMIDLSHRLPGHRMIKPAIGGLLVGLIALAVPQVLGTGYGWIQRSLGPDLLSIPLWIVLCLPLLRILATSLSIGTGGSGGIFGPGMVIGAFTGAAIWRLLEPIAPGVPHSPVPFVIVGMMACFGGISRAPLAVMLMVAEMTGSLTILAPAMVAVGLAYLIVRRNDDTIYRSQLKNREEAPARRLALSMPLSSSLQVERVMRSPRLVLKQDTPVAAASRTVGVLRVPGAPVVDSRRRFLGTVSTRALLDSRSPELSVARLADTSAQTVAPSSSLESALDAIAAGGGWATVLDQDRLVLGVIATSDVVRGYTDLLQSNIDRLAKVSPGFDTLEVRVTSASTVLSRQLREGFLPFGAVIVSIQRGSSLRFAEGATSLNAGDLVTILAHKSQFDAIRLLLAPGNDHEADARDDRPSLVGRITGAVPVIKDPPAEPR
jgi:CIC family chloride channel protein